VTTTRLDETEAIGLLIGSTITSLVLVTAFGLLALGFGKFWIVFPLGFGVVLPAALGLVGVYHATTASEKNGPSQFDTAWSDLQQQYVRGELSDEEFERRLEHLLENTGTEAA